MKNQLKINRILLLVFALAGMMPPIVFWLIDWLNGSSLDPWFLFLKNIIGSVITTVTISVGVVTVMNWLQYKFPWKSGILKRLLLEITLTSLTAIALITLLTFLMQPIFPVDNFADTMIDYMIVALIMNFVLVSITEGIFFFKRWKDSELQAELLKKEQVIAQLESLKNQVNPHFLFNSLSTLSGLIDYDQKLSKEFVDNLSAVYRYVLEHNNETVVTLRTEVRFIKAYTELLKKRHGDKLAFHFSISESTLERAIPPMTLQLLIENSVKHNIATRQKPLTIEVFSRNGYLVIRNNLQKKKVSNSSGQGLENIKKRYRYLSGEAIQIAEDERYFEVKIPTLDMSKT